MAKRRRANAHRSSPSQGGDGTTKLKACCGDVAGKLEKPVIERPR